MLPYLEGVHVLRVKIQVLNVDHRVAPLAPLLSRNWHAVLIGQLGRQQPGAIKGRGHEEGVLVLYACMRGLVVVDSSGH